MNKKETSGITLIALVITIVVMLILAVVTINLTLGENGIVKKAKEAILMNKKAQYMQEIDLEIADEHMERLSTPKEELFIESLQKRLQGTEVASQETVKVYTKKPWVDKADINIRTLLVVYTVEGYQILVDVDNANCTGKARQDSFAKKGKDCTISFDANTGEGSMENKTTSEGLYIELPECSFTKTNYTFVGWYEDAEGSGERYNPGEAFEVAENKTLYAKWSQYAISIKYNAGFETTDTMSDTTIELEKTDNLLENSFIRQGYTFAGWKDQDDNSYSDGQEVTASKDLTLTAQWTPIDYQISYNLDGGELASGKTNPTTYNVETDSFILNNPSKSEWLFTGWTGTNGSTPQKNITITKGSIGDRNYTANWATYTVTYNANGGSGSAMSNSTGASISLKSNGYTAPSGTNFVEWNTASDGSGTSYKPGQTVAANLNLYAIWSLTKSQITTAMTSSAESLKSLYGRTVSTAFFTSNEGNDWNWKLFYDDATYVFLIASDYVPTSKLPANGNTGFGSTDLIKDSSSNYKAKFCNSGCNDGVLTSGTIYKSGSRSTAITNNRLTSTYLKWVASYSSSTNYNIQAVAFMMDTSKWSAFAGNQYTTSGKKAEAIGGPTVELFIKSWNTSHTKQLDTNPGKNSTGYSTIDHNSYNLGTTSDMWIDRDTSKAAHYFLASPYSSYNFTLMTMGVNSWGTNTYPGSHAYSTAAFRPVVSIPKSAIN